MSRWIGVPHDDYSRFNRPFREQIGPISARKDTYRMQASGTTFSAAEIQYGAYVIQHNEDVETLLYIEGGVLIVGEAPLVAAVSLLTHGLANSGDTGVTDSVQSMAIGRVINVPFKAMDNQIVTHGAGGGFEAFGRGVLKGEELILNVSTEFPGIGKK